MKIGRRQGFCILMILVLCLAVSNSFALETVDRNGKKYIADWEDPAHVRGEQWDDGGKYYVRDDGEVPTGWFQEDGGGRWHYANSQGLISTPWNLLLAGVDSLVIPPYVTSIEMDELSGLPKDAVLYVTPGSYGERFAVSNALPYDNGQKHVAGTDIRNEEEKISWIIANYITPEMSSLEKIRVLHDWIVNNTRYDPEYGGLHGNPRNLLTDQLGICGEHDPAYTKLLAAAGIESRSVSTGAMNHAWNLVRLNGKWYHVDTTWDDPGDGSEGVELTGSECYDYFLLSDNEIAVDHIWYDDEDACNFILRNNLGGFKLTDGKLRYYDEATGEMVTGWKTIRDTDYSWDKTELKTTEEVRYERFYMSGDGTVQHGWQTIEGNRYYFWPDGVMARGISEIDGEKYYFDQSGRLMTGLAWAGNKLIRLDGNGKLIFGIQHENGRFFGYSLSDGYSNTRNGEVVFNDAAYQLDGSNAVITGIFMEDDKIWNFGQDGKREDVGWICTDQGWMYSWYGVPLTGGYYTLEKDGHEGQFNFDENGFLTDCLDMNWNPTGIFNVSKPAAHVHLQETIPGREATQTEPGLTRGIRCAACGAILSPQTEIPPFSQVACFVDRCYGKILNRPADESGLEDWTEQLESQYLAAANIIGGFVNSPEFRDKPQTNEEKVEIMYNTMLDRPSDPAGKEYWVSMLDTGLSINAVAAGFSGSQEFIGVCKEYGIDNGTYDQLEARDRNAGVTGFVSRCYQEALDRNADVDGLNSWCGLLLEGKQTPQEVAHGFVSSAEMQNRNQSNEEFIRTMYRLYLGREADPAGFEYWVGQLDGGKARGEIEQGFANSSEFAGIVAEYGLE